MLSLATWTTTAIILHFSNEPTNMEAHLQQGDKYLLDTEVIALFFACRHQPLQWRHKVSDLSANLKVVFNRLIWLTSKRTSKIRISDPLWGEPSWIPSQRVGNSDRVSLSWRHDAKPAAETRWKVVRSRLIVEAFCTPLLCRCFSVREPGTLLWRRVHKWIWTFVRWAVVIPKSSVVYSTKDGSKLHIISTHRCWCFVWYAFYSDGSRFIWKTTHTHSVWCYQ